MENHVKNSPDGSHTLTQIVREPSPGSEPHSLAVRMSSELDERDSSNSDQTITDPSNQLNTDLDPIHEDQRTLEETVKLEEDDEMASRNKPRVEKGVKKVDEHQVKERASTAMFGLLEVLKNNDRAVQDHFRNKMTSEINHIVDDFGLDRARKENDGIKLVNSINEDLKRKGDMATIRAKHAAIADLLKKINDDDHHVKEEAATATEAAQDEPSGKREREIDELDETLTAMHASVKRLKGGRQTRRSSFPGTFDSFDF